MAVISLSILALCMIATIGFMLHAGWASDDPLLWLLNLPFAILNLLPYAVFAVITWHFRTRLALSLIVFFGVLMVSGLSMFLLYDMLVAHPDPGNGIVWLLLPIWQFSGIVLTAAVAILIDCSRRKAKPAAALDRGRIAAFRESRSHSGPGR